MDFLGGILSGRSKTGASSSATCLAPRRSRPLEAVCPIAYFDGIVVHVRGTSGRVSQHTIYVALGVNLAGKKELLGLWLAESEGAKFWLQVLTDLKNRGPYDIFVACVDGLAGFTNAIFLIPHSQP
jgi:putative transposase